MRRIGFIVALGLGIGGCASNGKDGTQGAQGPQGPAGSNGSDGQNGGQGPAGPEIALPGVYTLTNATGTNQVAAYLRAETGILSRDGHYDTGGAGTNAGLGSQGALAFDARTQRFFAVNAGDNSISMLALDADGAITATSTVPSGGKHPVSIAVHGDLVYVVNQGDTTATPVGANISGFRVDNDALTAIAGSTQPLSGTTDVHPTEIGFSPDGAYVVVAERLAGKLDTFKLVSGVAQAGSFQASAGQQPFAFDWSPEGFLIVAEVGSGAANGSSVSSYAIDGSGALTAVTSAMPTHQTAACWLVVAGGYAYIANAQSANLTGVDIGEDGSLALHEDSGITATTAGGSTDLAVTPDRGYLYALAGNPKSIYIFGIDLDGGLTPMSALPTTATAPAGLVAR